MLRFLLAFILCFVFLCKALFAHFLWINPRAYYLEPGEELRLTLGFGHNFPGAGGDFLEASYLKSLVLFSPSGQKISVREGKYPILFKTSALQEEGIYLLVAEKKPGFFSKTASGFARKPKNELEDVIECKFSKRYTKALIQVGSPRGQIYRKIIGHELEIIPLRNPANLRPGDELPVRILYRGKPLSKQFVFATYAGFSPTGPKIYFAFAARTNAKGEVKVRLNRRGIWLILVVLEKPYPRPEVCDVETVVATFTFELR